MVEYVKMYRFSIYLFFWSGLDSSCDIILIIYWTIKIRNSLDPTSSQPGSRCPLLLAIGLPPTRADCAYPFNSTT